MEKIIRIDKKEYTAKATALSLIIYRASFGRDGLQDIINMLPGSAQDSAAVDGVIILQLLWSYIKTADKNAPPFELWLNNQFAMASETVATVLYQVVELSFSNMQTKIKSNQVSTSGTREPLTTELLLCHAADRGLSLIDFEHMTVGMVLDYLTLCQNLDIEARNKKPEEPTRQATQADIDAF